MDGVFATYYQETGYQLSLQTTLDEEARFHLASVM